MLTLICGGARYVLGDIGCPGTDGEPEPDQCDEGDCDILSVSGRACSTRSSAAVRDLSGFG